MSRTTKIFIARSLIVFFCLGSLSPAWPGKEGIDLKIRGRLISAELQEVPLRLVLEKLGKEKGIWFRGDESVLGEKVSTRFKDLPLHEGLRRILSGINHVLVFDEDKGLVGLYILGEKNPGKWAHRDVGVLSGRSPPSRPAKEDTVGNDPFEIFPDAGHTGNPKTRSTDGTMGKHFSPPQDQDSEMSETPFTNMSSVPTNPFDEDAALLSENPFAETFPSSSDNPFDENIASPSEDPFADPLGEFLEERGKGPL